MAVVCPAWQWPAALEERGPSEDPSILLAGAARIGDVEMQIVAIRINDTLRWTPDFKRGIAEDTYRVNGLGEVLETTLEDLQSVASDLGDLLGGGGSSVVELATGPYRVWVMPASFGS
jgi:hypothetical protein